MPLNPLYFTDSWNIRVEEISLSHFGGGKNETLKGVAHQNHRDSFKKGLCENIGLIMPTMLLFYDSYQTILVDSNAKLIHYSAIDTDTSII